MNLGSRALALFVLLGSAGMTAAAPVQMAVPAGHNLAHRVQKVKPKRVAIALAPPAAAALRVSYENGLLSISAQDAPLSDILAQLHQHTGATIDAPGSMDDRIAVELGPGPPAQVVAALLEATQFNYVIAGAANKPGAVQSIQLTVKPSLEEVAVSPPVPEAERPAASQSSVKADLTGGDEGVWDDVEVPVATPPPAGVAVPPAAAPPSTPADTAARPPQ